MKTPHVPLAALLLLAGCSDSLAPFQPEINNATDNFQFQATGLTSVSFLRTYTWQNTGTAATVNHSSAVTGGTTLLVIRDANGTQVYSDSLKASGTPATTTGVAGAWTIRVELTAVSGTLNFRAQKL